MEWKIVGSPGFATLDVILNANESLYAQPRSMVAMSTGVEVRARVGGHMEKQGILGGMRGLLVGESFATSIFSAKRDGQQVSFAPDAVGHIVPIELFAEKRLNIAKGAYMAHERSVALKTFYSGFKGLMAKKGLFLLQALGPGCVFLSTCGEVIHKKLEENERIAIDNDFVVAFDSTVTYQVVTAAPGLKDSIMSGEGLINRYTGPGTVLYQTRSRIARTSFIRTVLNSF